MTRTTPRFEAPGPGPSPTPTPRPEPATAVKSGSQSLSTGVLGGLFLLAWIAAYGTAQRLFPCVPELIVEPFPWIPLGRFPTVNREFFFLCAVLAVGFQFMASWELTRSRGIRLALVLASVLALAESWHIALQGPVQALAGRLHGQEVVLALLSVAMLGIVLLSWRRWPDLDGARLKRTVWSACWRWGAGLLAFWAVLTTAVGHPFYQAEFYTNWRILCASLFSVYLFLGLPYAVITGYAYKGLSHDVRDPGFMILLVLRAAVRARQLRLWQALSNRRTTLVMRDLAVKLFFVPVMIAFFFANCGKLFAHLPPAAASPYLLAFHSIMLMDVSLALLGYLCASRWLGNKSVSVEPTLLGWAVVLACYPPFNSVTEQYLPYQANFGGRPWLDLGGLDSILKGVALGGYLIYLLATMSFGLRFSNLTHRGIIDGGPYAWVRHPAYIGKNLAWWSESVRSFSSPWQFLFLLLWNAIYAARALTEERHLMKDPDYQAYARRVRYRFFPGLL